MNGPGFPYSGPFPPLTWENAVATDFTGKTALITGADLGVGQAIALGLAGAGAHPGTGRQAS